MIKKGLQPTTDIQIQQTTESNTMRISGHKVLKVPSSICDSSSKKNAISTQLEWTYETQVSNTVPKGIESDESEVEEEFVPKRAKIESMSQEISDKEIRSCDQCGAQMMKRMLGTVQTAIDSAKNLGRDFGRPNLKRTATLAARPAAKNLDRKEAGKIKEG
ncbi:hypothetical protein BpHYR1_026157 [Brachionus plicatilis]|uniref:Uncharacterized protein n=1 Tax=Brachionus plicatilis TaxID=10195 RepID=A0A3M7T7T0_BRAPC|nr:hypothetical protein BpHYR1_026157 [Brachionus plicatilis]